MMPDKRGAALIVAQKLEPEHAAIEDEVQMIAQDLMEGIHSESHQQVVHALEALCAYIQKKDLEQDEMSEGHDDMGHGEFGE